MGIGRDPADMRRPGPGWEAPSRPRRQLQERGELAPRFTTVVTAKESTRLGAGIDSTLGRAHCDREHTRSRQSAVDPDAAAVGRSLNTTLPKAGVNDIGIARIDRKALRTATRERKRDLPGASALIE